MAFRLPIKISRVPALCKTDRIIKHFDTLPNNSPNVIYEHQYAALHQNNILADCKKCFKISVQNQLSYLSVQPNHRSFSSKGSKKVRRYNKNITEALQPQKQPKFREKQKHITSKIWPPLQHGFTDYKKVYKPPKYRTLPKAKYSTAAYVTKKGFSTLTNKEIKELAQNISSSAILAPYQTHSRGHKSCGNIVDVEHAEENTKRMRKLFGCCDEPKVLKWRDTEKPKLDECSPCDSRFSSKTISPKLEKLKKRFDNSKMKYRHTCPPPKIAPTRSDAGMKIVPSVLKALPVYDDCIKCSTVGTICPKLERPKKLYDDSKMKYRHICIQKEDPCDIPALRSDINLKIVPRKLQPILSADCILCNSSFSNEAPPLKRPKKLYDDSKMVYCVPAPIIEPCSTPRLDDVCGYKVTPKKLQRLDFFQDCKPCAGINWTAPPLKSPKKLYDDSKMKYPHICPPPDCVCAPKCNDELGLKVSYNKIKNIPHFHDCVLCDSRCWETPDPKRTTNLDKCKKMKHEYFSCPENESLCFRSDDLNYKIEPKRLPPLPKSDCLPCITIPTKAPKLVKLLKRFDDKKMKYHKICPPILSICAERADDLAKYKVPCASLKPLPSFVNDCVKCDAEFPPNVITNKLQFPKRLFNPHTLDRPYFPICDPPPRCNIDPPRLDDICCWKPTKRILPSFLPDNCKPLHKCCSIPKIRKQCGCTIDKHKIGGNRHYSTICKSSMNHVLRESTLGEIMLIKYMSSIHNKHSDIIGNPVAHNNSVKYSTENQEAIAAVNLRKKCKVSCDSPCNYYLDQNMPTLPEYKRIVKVHNKKRIFNTISTDENKGQYNSFQKNKIPIKSVFEDEKRSFTNSIFDQRIDFSFEEKQHTTNKEPTKTLHFNDICSNQSKTNLITNKYLNRKVSGYSLLPSFYKQSDVPCKSCEVISIRRYSKKKRKKKCICRLPTKAKRTLWPIFPCPKFNKRTKESELQSDDECDKKDKNWPVAECPKYNSEDDCSQNLKPYYPKYSGKKKKRVDPLINICPVREPDKPKLVCTPKPRPSLWERICAYFRARPNCPAPNDWKKEKLKKQAYQAAKDAGLSICSRREVQCGAIKKPSSNNKKYSTYTLSTRTLNTYPFPTRKEYLRKSLTCRKLASAKSLSQPFSDNGLVGKMFQVKLSKIGIRNSLIPRNIEDEPYSFCQMCKFVPKNAISPTQKIQQCNLKIREINPIQESRRCK